METTIFRLRSDLYESVLIFVSTKLQNLIGLLYIVESSPTFRQIESKLDLEVQAHILKCTFVDYYL